MNNAKRFHVVFVVTLALFVAAEIPVLATDTILGRVRLTDLELRQTSGTVLLQDIRAKSARLAPGSLAIDADDIDVRIFDSDTDRMVRILSPFARLYHHAEDAVVEDRDPTDDELVEVREHIRAFSPDDRDLPFASRNDFILLDPEGGLGIEVDFGDEGELDAQTIYWSERWQRFLSLGPFRQRVTDEEGTLEVRGNAFFTSRTFADWEYREFEDELITFDIIPSAEEEQ